MDYNFQSIIVSKHPVLYILIQLIHVHINRAGFESGFHTSFNSMVEAMATAMAVAVVQYCRGLFILSLSSLVTGFLTHSLGYRRGSADTEDAVTGERNVVYVGSEIAATVSYISLYR